MKRQLLALLFSLFVATLAHAQVSPPLTTLPYAANAVADIGNGPIKVRMTQGNASVFTMSGSGTGSTSGSSTSLTLTGTPATPPLVGALISGTGITSGTTIAAYNGTTGITLSAAMTVPGGTTVSWGAACPASAAGIPTHYIQASVMADYYLLYTQARVCAISPGGPANTLLVLPIFYDRTTPQDSGGTGAVSSVSNIDGTLTISPTTGAVVAAVALSHANNWTGKQNFNQNSGAVPTALTGTVSQFVGADAASPRIEIDAFGGIPRFSCVRYDGTNAARTTLQTNDEICSLNSFGYNGTAVVGPNAAVRTYASQNWSVGANGTYLDVAVTPNGSTTITPSARFEQSGGITVPPTVTGGDKGAGTGNFAGLYVNGLAVSTSTPLTLTNTHIFVGNAGNVPTDVALSGDAALANTGAMTLATVNPNIGNNGSATQIAQINADAKGRILGVTQITVTPAVGSITGLGPNVATALGNALSAAGGVTSTIQKGTMALGTSSIASGACATVVTAVATGITTSDVPLVGFSSDPKGSNGYAPSANGMLTIQIYPSSNAVNANVCNNTASAIVPSPITLNWLFLR